MPKYKVTRVSLVVAASKAEVLQAIAAAPDEALEFVSVVEQAAAPANGFWRSVRRQVTGK